jgi:hypothetical protein
LLYPELYKFGIPAFHFLKGPVMATFNAFDPATPITAAWLNSVDAFVASGGGGGVEITPHSFTGDGTTNQFLLTVTPTGKEYVFAQLGALMCLPVDFSLVTIGPALHPSVVFTAPPTGPIYIRVVQSGGGGSGGGITASNLGAGAGVFASKVINDLQFKSLVAGTNTNYHRRRNYDHHWGNLWWWGYDEGSL